MISLSGKITFKSETQQQLINKTQPAAVVSGCTEASEGHSEVKLKKTLQ